MSVPGGEKLVHGLGEAHLKVKDPGLGGTAYKTETHTQILPECGDSGPGMKNVAGQARVSMMEPGRVNESKTQSS